MCLNLIGHVTYALVYKGYTRKQYRASARAYGFFNKILNYFNKINNISILNIYNFYLLKFLFYFIYVIHLFFVYYTKIWEIYTYYMMKIKCQIG